MAKKNTTQTQGPSMPLPGADPVNPSDEIFKGRALPIMQAQATTERRAFTCVTRNPLHFNEGIGTDEVKPRGAQMIPNDGDAC